MLVYQENGDILSFLREVLERFLDRGGLGLRVDHEEIPLGIRSVRHMLSNRIKSGSHDVLLQRDGVSAIEGTYTNACEEETGHRAVGATSVTQTIVVPSDSTNSSSPITARNCRSW